MAFSLRKGGVSRYIHAEWPNFSCDPFHFSGILKTLNINISTGNVASCPLKLFFSSSLIIHMNFCSWPWSGVPRCLHFTVVVVQVYNDKADFYFTLARFYILWIKYNIFENGRQAWFVKIGMYICLLYILYIFFYIFLLFCCFMDFFRHQPLGSVNLLSLIKISYKCKLINIKSKSSPLAISCLHCSYL